MTNIERIYDKIPDLNDQEATELAALLLQHVDPTLENLTLFWECLSDSFRGELAARIELGELKGE